MIRIDDRKLHPVRYHQESFTEAERQVLERFFTNTDLPVFALINLPEVVKGALFARYSRSAKSIRRLFLDEFIADGDSGIETIAQALGGDDPIVDMQKAEKLYERVFFEYGDDSVAQLGGTHIACEQASNVLTKVLEWGRLAAYLEQSTRYIAYDARLGDRYRYLIPEEIETSSLGPEYTAFMEDTFDTYSRLVATMKDHYEQRFPKQGSDSPGVWNATIRAKACDTARGLLPASTLSNVGIYGTGQAYEMSLLRMQAHPLQEVRSYGSMMLTELRKVIPSFLTRVDRPDRGIESSRYLQEIAADVEQAALTLDQPGTRSPWSVTLTDWDPEAELKVAAATLYPFTELPDEELLRRVGSMPVSERSQLIRRAVGDRRNRRHKPGRSFERTTYRFDIVCDFGAFRDLQRHRMLTLDWQRFSTRLGFDLPDDIVGTQHETQWERITSGAAAMYETVRAEIGPDVAQYVVPLAAHVRFSMEMNPREAFHLIELRSQPAGHITYRRVAQEMHRQIAEVAGHEEIARAMSFVDHTAVDLERLEAERKAEKRRSDAAATNRP